jgi:hypothetical protein
MYDVSFVCFEFVQVRSSHLTYKWGFDGGSSSQCWEVSCALERNRKHQQAAAYSQGLVAPLGHVQAAAASAGR